MLLNRSSKQILIALSSSPSNTTIFGGCTRRPKHLSGPPRRSTSLLMPRIGIDFHRWSSTSSPTSWLFLQHLMASSTRISAEILQQKSRCLKLDVSTAFRLLSKTSTVRRTHSSLTHTSRTPPRSRISYGQSKPYRAFNRKHSGPFGGATPPLPALPNV